ncbi:CoA transferase [uncultured Jatrophihabitans sp.]|uniref:CoA transferase n=1 Tax=uncultured Jatrophihabitans sp. TaxID=1610747 RepID=UPI0035C972A8
MDHLSAVHIACGQGDRPDSAPPGLLEVLARDLGVRISDAPPVSTTCSVVQSARWGVASLSGAGDGPPALPEAPVATRISWVIATLAHLTGNLGARVDVDPAELLSARAREAGWTRRGAVSVNGSARLIPSVGGWLAVNLARAEDREVLPAVLGAPVPSAAEWAALSEWTASRPGDVVVDALQQVGVPAAVLGAEAGSEALRVIPVGTSQASGRRESPLVVDFSAMWAGPLAAHLLHRTGARVTTVEDPARPDGARGGPAQFYCELHRGHELHAVDLRSGSGRADLARLVDSADIVIEASRPRALRGLGLHAEQFLAARPGRTWLSITGYGRQAYDGLRVAFGDDAAVAGGLVARGPDGAPVFVGDAIADPLTGLWAATAAAASWTAGGGRLLDVSMAGVASEVSAATGGPRHTHHLRRDGAGCWWVSHEDEDPVRC